MAERARDLTKFEWMVGSIGMVGFVGLSVWIIVTISGVLLHDLVEYLRRDSWSDRLLQVGATTVLAFFSLAILAAKERLPRLYRATGVVVGLAAIWLAVDDVAAMLSKANTTELGRAHAALLLLGMFTFAKSLEDWRSVSKRWQEQHESRAALLPPH